MLSLRIVVCVDQEDSAEARWSGDANIRRALLLFVAKYNILIQLLSHPVAEAGFLVKKTRVFLISLLQLVSWKTLTFK